MNRASEFDWQFSGQLLPRPIISDRDDERSVERFELRAAANFQARQNRAAARVRHRRVIVKNASERLADCRENVSDNVCMPAGAI
jgi:hypothetical protein